MLMFENGTEYAKLICCVKVLLRGRPSRAKAVMVKPFSGHSCFYR
jgi:hypothetical protein